MSAAQTSAISAQRSTVCPACCNCSGPLRVTFDAATDDDVSWAVNADMVVLANDGYPRHVHCVRSGTDS